MTPHTDTPDAADQDLQHVARHEAGHAVACWHYSGKIIATTLGSDTALDGSVWSTYGSNGVVGERQRMVGLAAGAAAVGEKPEGDDAKRLTEAARRVCGLTATPEQIKAEVREAEVQAVWLCQEYAAEIQQVAEHLITFHELLAGFERRYHADL
jgi:hypothetical protein